MLALLASWIAVSLASLVLGSLLLALCNGGKLPARPADRFLSRWYLGMFALASLFLAASLIGPVRATAGMLLLIGLVVACLLAPSVRRDCLSSLPSRNELLALVLIAAAAAADASGLVTHYDTGLYHYPLIRWLHEYGSVPGLGLFHRRFAFSSSWFAFSAVFETGILQGRGVSILNGLLMTMVLFHLALALRRCFGGEAHRGDWLWIGGAPPLVVFSLWQRFHLSPSPNFAVAAGILYVCWLLENRNSAASCGAALLAAAGAFAVKLSALPLLAATLLCGLLAQPRRGFPAAAAISAMVALPIALANLRTSGCPFYPSSLLRSAASTSTPPESARAEQAEILQWARYVGPYPAGAAYFSLGWVRNWLSHPVNAAATLLAVVGIAGVAWLRAAVISFWIGLGGAVFVFLTAPDLRFGIGYLALLPGAFVAAVLDRHQWPMRSIRPRLGILALLVAACLCLDVLVAHWLYWGRQGDHRPVLSFNRLLLPAPLPVTPSVTSRSNDIEYRVPIAGDSCWAAPLPCTPYPPAPAVRFCDPEKSLAGGFCRAAP